MNALTAVVLVGCGGAALPASNHVDRPVTLYDSLFHLDHTWEFGVTLVEHVSAEHPDATQVTTLAPTHCKVATVDDRPPARIARITCESTDPRDEMFGVSTVIAGTYLATPLGVWRIEPTGEDPPPQPPVEDMMLPAAPSPLHRQTPKQACLDANAPQVVALDHGVSTLARWGDAWCVASVWGCHSTWSVECYRPAEGWIGGASRGYFDPAAPGWIEVRWGEAPPYPFGVDQ